MPFRSPRVHRRREASSRGAVGTPQNRNVPRPPSIRRSLIIGAATAFAFFALIQWVFHLSDTSTWGNILFAGVAMVLYTGLNYWMDRIKYRRYVNKSQGSDK